MDDPNPKRRKQRKGKSQVASSTGIPRGNMPEDLVKHQGKNGNLQAFKIGGHTVIFMKLASDEQRKVGGEAGPQGVGAAYASQKQSGYECFIHHRSFGLKPLEAWKAECAKGITQVTGVSTPATSVVVTAIFPTNELYRCPSCGNPTYVLSDGTCSSCHTKIITAPSLP